MRLRRKPAYLRTGGEEKPRKKVNIDKYIYIGLLILVVILGFWRLSKAIFYVTGYGQIIIPKFELQPINDIRILKLYVKEGQQVKPEEILCSYCEKEEFYQPVSEYQLIRDRENLKREIGKINNEKKLLAKNMELDFVKLEEQLKNKFNEKEYYENLLKKKNEEMERMKKMVLLETYLPYNIKNLEEEIEKIRYRIIGLEEEISFIELQIKTLKEKKKIEMENLNNQENILYSQIGILKISHPLNTKYFYSPVYGTVTKIYPQEKEVVIRGQTIMEIYRLEEIKIKSFFEQRDLKFLKKGRNVIIQYPDGYQKEGVITDVYFATLPQPPEFQKKYEPVHRSVIADIVPLKQDVELSGNLYMMSVKIYVPRFSKGGGK